MPTFAAISMPGPFELVVIMVIIMMFFGLGKLPQVFESLGKGIKAFKDAQRDDEPSAPPKQLGHDPVSVEEAQEVKTGDRVDANR